MFWGCFLYDKKVPYHIWKPETAAERKKAKLLLTKLNKEIEPIMQEQWELNTGIQRLVLRNLPRRKPEWKWNAKNGKLTRGKGKGIDWYRYQVSILQPKLLPFAKECMKNRPHTVVQEDKAPAHDHHIQNQIYSQWGVERLLWPGNSPDLNMIEPSWAYLKRATTRKGGLRSRAEAEKAWATAWKELPQERIQQWIKRIMRHIQEVIRLEGGNEYREGAEDTAENPKKTRGVAMNKNVY
jgi:hypothetical protein